MLYRLRATAALQLYSFRREVYSKGRGSKIDVAGPRPEARGSRPYSEEDARMAPVQTWYSPGTALVQPRHEYNRKLLERNEMGTDQGKANHNQWNQSHCPANLGQNFTPIPVQVVCINAASHQGRDRCQWWPDQILSCFLIIYKNNQLVIQSSAKKKGN